MVSMLTDPAVRDAVGRSRDVVRGHAGRGGDASAYWAFVR